MARIANTLALFHHTNNYFTRNCKVYETLKGLCRRGSAAEYINIPFIAQAKDGRSAWITLCKAYETKASHDLIVDSAQEKMKEVAYTGNKNFSFNQYVAIHRTAHMMLARHEGHTKWSDHDKVKALLAGIKDPHPNWKAALAQAEATKSNYKFNGMVEHLQGVANKIESQKRAASNEERKARVFGGGGGSGKNGKRGKRGGNNTGGGGGGGTKCDRDGNAVNNKLSDKLSVDIWNLLSSEMRKAILDATAKVRPNRKAKAERTDTDANSSTQSTQGYTVDLSSEASPLVIAESPSTSTVVEQPKGVLKKQTQYQPSNTVTDPKGDAPTANEHPKGVPKQKKTRDKLSKTVADPKGEAKVAFKDDDPKTTPLIEAGFRFGRRGNRAAKMIRSS
jgi:hypothetical protein